MKRIILTSVLVITAFVLVSCTGSGSYTEISGTWKKPGFSGKKYNDILVVAITNSIVNRNKVESAIVKELAKGMIKATTSVEQIDLSKLGKSEDGKFDSTKVNELKKSLTEKGYDGAIVVSLLDVKEKTEYVPGSTYYAPGYYGYNGGYGYSGFYGYYYNTYNVVNTPGYYVEKTNFYIETRLFDLTDDNLVWASTSETLNPPGINSLSNSLSAALAEELVGKKILRK